MKRGGGAGRLGDHDEAAGREGGQPHEGFSSGSAGDTAGPQQKPSRTSTEHAQRCVHMLSESAVSAAGSFREERGGDPLSGFSPLPPGFVPPLAF